MLKFSQNDEIQSLIDEYEDEEDNLFRSIPLQCNQNSNYGTVPISREYGLTQLHQNYMYHSLLHSHSMLSQPKIYKDIIHLRKTDEVRQGMRDFDNIRMVSITNNQTVNSFDYDPSLISMYKDKLEVQSNCEWLDNRLDIDLVVNDSQGTLDHLVTLLRMTFINVSNDLMIYYHTNSLFILQVAKLESYNLLILLKDPRLKHIIYNLQDGFSSFLLRIVTEESVLENNGKDLNISIPLLVETIMNNAVVMEPKKPSMKARFRQVPKVVFQSFYLPASLVMPNNHINVILDKKIISMQRKYFCKVVLEGPIEINLYAKTKGECYKMEILFDCQFNYWTLVKNDLMKWLDSLIRSSAKCMVDKVCISYVSHDFFCCDEVQNLMKRHHLLREVDSNFAKLIKWVKVNQVENSIL